MCILWLDSIFTVMSAICNSYFWQTPQYIHTYYIRQSIPNHNVIFERYKVSANDIQHPSKQWIPATTCAHLLHVSGLQVVLNVDVVQMPLRHLHKPAKHIIIRTYIYTIPDNSFVVLFLCWDKCSLTKIVSMILFNWLLWTPRSRAKRSKWSVILSY